jgi:hypothetical protein
MKSLFLNATGMLFAALTAAHAQTPARPLFETIAPPTPAQMSAICKGTDDLRECGKRVEADQIAKAKDIVVRRGKVLTISQNPSGALHFLDEGGAEAGESFSFFSYHAIADAVTLYHTKSDKLGFMVVLRKSGEGSAIPNEPIFHSSGEEFVTVDVCDNDCERRITRWKTTGQVVRRVAEFVVPSDWKDATAAWTPTRGLWVEYETREGKKTIELAANDRRWIEASLR